jgi:hypothetical protein
MRISIFTYNQPAPLAGEDDSDVLPGCWRLGFTLAMAAAPRARGLSPFSHPLALPRARAMSKPMANLIIFFMLFLHFIDRQR